MSRPFPLVLGRASVIGQALAAATGLALAAALVAGKVLPAAPDWLPETLRPLGVPAAAVGLGVTATLLLLLAGEALRCRAARGSSGWLAEAAEWCKDRADNPYDPAAIRRQYEDFCRLTGARLDGRWALRYFVPGWLPMCLGLWVGLQRLDQVAVVRQNYLEVFWPTCVGIGESVFVCLFAALTRGMWGAVLDIGRGQVVETPRRPTAAPEPAPAPEPANGTAPAPVALPAVAKPVKLAAAPAAPPAVEVKTPAPAPSQPAPVPKVVPPTSSPAPRSPASTSTIILPPVRQPPPPPDGSDGFVEDDS